jgi:hypothetical protein
MAPVDRQCPVPRSRERNQFWCGVGCVAGAGMTGAEDGVAVGGFTFAGVAGAAPVVVGELEEGRVPAVVKIGLS